MKRERHTSNSFWMTLLPAGALLLVGLVYTTGLASGHRTFGVVALTLGGIAAAIVGLTRLGGARPATSPKPPAHGAIWKITVVMLCGVGAAAIAYLVAGGLFAVLTGIVFVIGGSLSLVPLEPRKPRPSRGRPDD